MDDGSLLQRASSWGVRACNLLAAAAFQIPTPSDKPVYSTYWQRTLTPTLQTEAWWSWWSQAIVGLLPSGPLCAREVTRSIRNRHYTGGIKGPRVQSNVQQSVEKPRPKRFSLFSFLEQLICMEAHLRKTSTPSHHFNRVNQLGTSTFPFGNG